MNIRSLPAKARLAMTGILVLAAAAIVTTGCGSSSSSSSSSDASSSSTTTSENQAFAQKYPGCATHLKDGDNAPRMTFTDLRGVRYGEISLLCGKSGATMYNTSGLNNAADPKDTAPADLWNGVSESEEATHYQVPSVWKNGPRGWTVDKINLPVSKEPLDFNGLKARWFAYPEYPPTPVLKNQKLNAKNAFKPNTIQRASKIYFSKGEQVFTLKDPDGNAWVMQAWAEIVDPNLRYDDLTNESTMNKKLSLPSGWTYQVVTLKKDLEIVAPDGKATVTQDNLQDSYDECNPGACSYDPLSGK